MKNVTEKGAPVNNFSFSHLLAGGAFLGVLSAFWGHLKAVAWRLISVMVQRVEITHAMHSMVLDYMCEHYRLSTVYDRKYNITNDFIRQPNGRARVGQIPFEETGNTSMIFWRGWFPLVYDATTLKAAKPDPGGIQTSSKEQPIKLTCIRGTFDIEGIIAAASQARNTRVWQHDAQQKEKTIRFFIRHVPDLMKKSTEGKPTEHDGWLPWYRQRAMRPIGYNPDDLGQVHGTEKALEKLIFPAHVVKLIEEIKQWRRSEDWYKDRNIPWKRGWLLYGPPGTGKTAIARAFAQDLDLPIYVYNLSELSNYSFMKSWTEMVASAPCMALIEDIDAVFHGRKFVGRPRYGPMMMYGPEDYGSLHNGDTSNGKPRSQKLQKIFDIKNKDEDEEKERYFGGGQLTFDCLINMLDGVEKNEGVFTIITTNHIEHVDEALGKPVRREDGSIEFISSRPGRIDKAIELTYMEVEDKVTMLHRILKGFPDELELLEEIVRRHPDVQETPAQFQERCAQIALKAYWQSEQAKKETVSC